MFNMKANLNSLIDIFNEIKVINTFLYMENQTIFNQMSEDEQVTFENSFKVFIENESVLFTNLNFYNDKELTGEEIVLFKNHLLALLLSYREYYRIFIDHIFQMHSDKRIVKRNTTYYDQLKEYDDGLKELDEILRIDVRNKKEHPISRDKTKETHFIYINETVKYHQQDFNIKIVTFNKEGKEKINKFNIIDISSAYAQSLLNALKQSVKDFN